MIKGLHIAVRYMTQKRLLKRVGTIGWPKMASQNQKSGFAQSMKKSWFSVIFFKKNVQGSK